MLSDISQHKQIKFLCVIQARLTSTRLPNKVMQMVGGKTMLRRVWDEAKLLEKFYGRDYFRVIVAWPERYPSLDENNVLARYLNLVDEFRPKYVVRLTADCPLIQSTDIYQAILNFEGGYYSNHKDGYDVQIFDPYDCPVPFHREHVIADFSTPSTGLSVNTRADLEYVRLICETR
jgi:cytidylyltransferase family protein